MSSDVEPVEETQPRISSKFPLAVLVFDACPVHQPSCTTFVTLPAFNVVSVFEDRVSDCFPHPDLGIQEQPIQTNDASGGTHQSELKRPMLDDLDKHKKTCKLFLNRKTLDIQEVKSFLLLVMPLLTQLADHPPYFADEFSDKLAHRVDSKLAVLPVNQEWLTKHKTSGTNHQSTINIGSHLQMCNDFLNSEKTDTTGARHLLLQTMQKIELMVTQIEYHQTETDTLLKTKKEKEEIEMQKSFLNNVAGQSLDEVTK